MYRVIFSGFSLFEILIVLFVSAVLLCVALPSYQYLLSSLYQHQMQIRLLALAAKLQRYYHQHGTYQGAILSLKQDAHYHISFTKVSRDYFRLQAMTDSQAPCRWMSVDALGTRRASSATKCW